MAQYNQRQARPIIPQPVGITNEQMVAIKDAFVTHFQPIVTPSMLVANRKGVYALIINGSDEHGNTLEVMTGTANAKLITEDVMHALSTKLSVVKGIAPMQAQTTYHQ